MHISPTGRAQVEIVGYLPFLVLQSNENNTVVGVDGVKVVLQTHNMVAIVPAYDPKQPESTLLYLPAEATYVSSLVVLEAACRTPLRPSDMPRSEVAKYTWLDRWFTAKLWQYPHWWEGTPHLRRVNLYSRPMRQVPAGSNVLSEEARENNIRWYIVGHELLRVQVTLRAADLPSQGLDPVCEGLVGRVVKWAPAGEGPDEPMLFHVVVEGRSPFEQLGMGVDLEEHEVRLASRRYGVRSASERCAPARLGE